MLNLFRKIVQFIYRQCDQILISSKGFVESIEYTGGYDGCLEYLPNWVEPEYQQKMTGQAAEFPDLPQGFKVMFAGNIGAAQDFETILTAAEKLKGYAEIHWVIVGDGRRLGWVEKQVQSRGLEKNFHLLGRFPSQSMPLFFEQADAMLVTLKNEPIFALTAPGKIQSYMSSAKPIIAALAGEGATLIEESGSGLTCSPENPDELARRVLDLYALSSEERDALGLSGYAFCQKNFAREKLFDKLESLMERHIRMKKNEKK